MVNVTVDNEVISIFLLPGQSVTVPANQHWKVSVKGSSSVYLVINNSRQFSSIPEVIYLTSGDVLKNNSGGTDNEMWINGIRIK